MQSESICLYDKVQTPDGVGVVIQLSCMKVNGLYYAPECSDVTVWYGMGNVCNGWVQRSYDLKEVSLVKTNQVDHPV
jgi:hypothetical protein